MRHYTVSIPGHDLHGHTSAVNSLAFLPDDKRILTASADGLVRIWALPSPELLVTLKEENSANAAISPDGLLIATVGDTLSTVPDGGRNFWAGSNGRVNARSEGSRRVYDVASQRRRFSPAGIKVESVSSLSPLAVNAL